MWKIVGGIVAVLFVIGTIAGSGAAVELCRDDAGLDVRSGGHVPEGKGDRRHRGQLGEREPGNDETPRPPKRAGRLCVRGWCAGWSVPTVWTDDPPIPGWCAKLRER